jgi:hypothetical protein
MRKSVFNLGSSQIWLQTTLRVRRAARPALVPSQAPATVSIAESSADTFPAVYAPHPADASTCRASFPGACLAVASEGGAGASAGPGRCLPLSCGPGVHEIARRGSVTADSGALQRHGCLPQKTRMAPCHIPPPLPTLRFACTGPRAGAMDRVPTPADT